MNLKAGDRVLVSACYHEFISTVEKITPAGNIRLKNGELYMPDGVLKTKDKWSCSHIQPLTPEKEELLRRSAYISRILAIMHKTSSITYAQAVEIQQVLEKNKNGSD